MLRKLFVNALALLAVLAVAGGAMAAASHDDTAKKDRPAAQAHQEERAAETGDDAAGDDADDAEEPALLESTDAADEAQDNFGAVRSAEVAAYHDCRETAADEAADEPAEDACEKPGPAWQNDAHPVFGTDGAKAGEQPGGDHRTEASAQRPERAAKGKAHGKPSR